MKNMIPSARPGIFLRSPGDFGPNWVVLDVPDRFIKLLLIEGAGVRPALSEMSADFPFLIEILGVPQ